MLKYAVATTFLVSSLLKHLYERASADPIVYLRGLTSIRRLKATVFSVERVVFRQLLAVALLILINRFSDRHRWEISSLICMYTLDDEARSFVHDTVYSRRCANIFAHQVEFDCLVFAKMLVFATLELQLFTLRHSRLFGYRIHHFDCYVLIFL